MKASLVAVVLVAFVAGLRGGHAQRRFPFTQTHVKTEESTEKPQPHVKSPFEAEPVKQPTPCDFQRVEDLPEASQLAVDLIKFVETLHVRCSNGTIGYGHRCSAANVTAVVSEAQAVELLQRDVARADACVRAALPACNLTANMMAALVSLTHQKTCEAFTGSTLARLIQSHDYDGAVMELQQWDGDATARRQVEAKLFHTVDCSQLPPPPKAHDARKLTASQQRFVSTRSKLTAWGGIEADNKESGDYEQPNGGYILPDVYSMKPVRAVNQGYSFPGNAMDPGVGFSDYFVDHFVHKDPSVMHVPPEEHPVQPLIDPPSEG